MAEITPLLTGIAIRNFLRRVGRAGPYDFYREFRVVKPTTSYDSIRKYFYILRELGLIEFVEEAPSAAGFPRQLYRIIPGMEEDPRWGAPQVELYPATALGKRRYRKKIEKGERIPKGRRGAYR